MSSFMLFFNLRNLLYLIKQNTESSQLFPARLHADTASKLERCAQRATEEEHFSAKEMQKKMKKIDKERAAYRALFTEDRWGSKESYHLCINTSGMEIKHLIPVIAAYAKVWFEEKKADE